MTTKKTGFDAVNVMSFKFDCGPWNFLKYPKTRNICGTNIYLWAQPILYIARL